MRLDLTELLQQTGKELHFDGDIDVDLGQEDISLSGPAHMSLDIINAGELFLAKGKMKATVKLACARCLKEFESAFSAVIDERFSRERGKEREDEKEVEIGDEDIIVPISDDLTIDLSEIARQYLISETPIQVLCDSDCPGLESGKKEKSIDPRLLKLKEALKNAGTQEKTQ